MRTSQNAQNANFANHDFCALRGDGVLGSSPSPGPISMSAPPHYPLLTKNASRRVMPACGVPGLSDRSRRERGYNAPCVRCAAPKKEVGNGVSVAKLARASGGALPRLRCAQPAYRDRDAAGASVRRLGRLWLRPAGDEHGRDAALLGRPVEGLRQSDPKLDALLVSGMQSMCAMHISMATLVLGATWFGLR